MAAAKLSGHDEIEEDIRTIKSKQHEIDEFSSADGLDDEDVEGVEDNE